MKVCDLYGFRYDDLESAKLAVEQALGIRLDAHESLYFDGVYHRLGQPGEEHFILRRNIDPFDDEPAEPEFSTMGILLYINETERAKYLEQILTRQISELQPLRREELD